MFVKEGSDTVSDTGSICYPKYTKKTDYTCCCEMKLLNFILKTLFKCLLSVVVHCFLCHGLVKLVQIDIKI